MKAFILTGVKLIKYTRSYQVVELDADDVSDGYHTMNELYDHRRALTVALLNIFNTCNPTVNNRDYIEVFKSKQHHDGSMFDGYFIVGLIKENKTYISYHYDLKYWDQFAIPELIRAPEYDGHTNQDTIERLLSL